MNPSSLRSSVIFTLSFDAGMSTFSCSARLALRILVRRSAIGSLVIGGSLRTRLVFSHTLHPLPFLPTRLDHAWDFALERQFSEAEPASLELPEIAARAATQSAASIGPRLELGRALLLHNQRSFRHLKTP